MKKTGNIFCLTCTIILILVLWMRANDERAVFTGNRVKNPDSYLLDIGKMNGTDSHSLKLGKGDALQIQFETSSGSIRIEIKDPEGRIIYQGNGQKVTDFQIDIIKDGTYSILVTAKKASGKIRIQKI